jgi:hypothetical protein
MTEGTTMNLKKKMEEYKKIKNKWLSMDRGRDRRDRDENNIYLNILSLKALICNYIIVI